MREVLAVGCAEAQLVALLGRGQVLKLCEGGNQALRTSVARQVLRLEMSLKSFVIFFN